jgi:GH24 family phage-related lysozyme (muramidase)
VKVGPRAIACIKRFEGRKLKAYICPAGKWTIGYGNTRYPDGRKVKEGDRITEAQAEEMFRVMLAQFERGVTRLLQVKAPIQGGNPTNQAQFGALVSFAYNVGLDEDDDIIPEGLGDSTLLKLHRAGQYDRAANEFLKWVFAHGRRQKGLVKRRQAERFLYLRQFDEFDRLIEYQP